MQKSKFNPSAFVYSIHHVLTIVFEKNLVILIKKGYAKIKIKKEKQAFVSEIESTMDTCVLVSHCNKTNCSVHINETKTDMFLAIVLTDMQSKR